MRLNRITSGIHHLGIKKQTKPRIVCLSCGKRNQRERIKSFIKNGFSLKQIPCTNCGGYTLAEREE